MVMQHGHPPPCVQLRHPIARRVGLAAVILAVSVSASCSLGTTTKAGPGALQVRAVTIDEPVNGTSAAVRMVIDNATETDDVLLKVTTPSAGRATLHESTVSDTGISSMADLTEVDVPAGRQTVFRSGGLHVMLEDFTSDLALGDRVELTFTFAEAGERTVTAEVVPVGSTSEDMGGM